MVVTVMVMSCTENSLFRKQVFIFVNAPYEFRSLEERLAALQPLITSDRLSLFSAAEVSSRARGSGSSYLPFREAPTFGGGFKGKWWETGSSVYPMRELGGGGRMLTWQVRWDKTGCLRLCDLANDQADVKCC